MTRVRNHREPAPQPQPNAVDLLAELAARVAAMEKAQAKHHAEVLDRLAAQDTALARVADAVDCGSLDLEELRTLLVEALGPYPTPPAD